MPTYLAGVNFVAEVFIFLSFSCCVNSQYEMSHTVSWSFETTDSHSQQILVPKTDNKDIFCESVATGPERKTPEFSNSVDLDEVAHSEPPHLDLRCLPSSL